jgi:hypothetical protein
MLNLFLSEGTEEDEPALPSYLATLSHPSTTRITGLAAGQLPGKLNSEIFMSQEVLQKTSLERSIVYAAALVYSYEKPY